MIHKLKIETANELAKVYLDGQLLSEKLRGYKITQDAGELPRVNLSFIADVEYDGEVELEQSEIPRKIKKAVGGIGLEK